MTNEGFWLFPHAYPIEFFQLVVSILGVIANLWGANDAHRDLKIWKKFPHSAREVIVSKRNLFEEYMRLCILLSFVINGLVSVSFAPPNPGLEVDDPRYIQLVVARSVMMFASAMLAAKSVRDIRDRKRIRALPPMADPPAILDVIRDKASDIVNVIEETKVKGEVK
jgi:hypothetical protein